MEPVPYYQSPTALVSNEDRRVTWPTDPADRYKLIQAALAEMKRAKAV